MGLNSKWQVLDTEYEEGDSGFICFRLEVGSWAGGVRRRMIRVKRGVFRRRARQQQRRLASRQVGPQIFSVGVHHLAHNNNTFLEPGDGLL